MFQRLKKLFWVVAVGFFLRGCIIEPVRTTDDSMAPFVTQGEIVLISKVDYGIRIPGSGAMLWEWKQPQVGDIVAVVGVGDPPVNVLRRLKLVGGSTYTAPDGKVIKLKDDQFYVEALQVDSAMDSKQLGPVGIRSILGKVAYVWSPKNKNNNGAQ